MRALSEIYEAEFAPTAGHRAEGFRMMVRFVERRRRLHGPLTLVETGCIRDLASRESDGHSTVLFDRLATETGSRFFSIDVSPQNCGLARRLCPQATVLCGDSVKLLYRIGRELGRIDLLYLDSFDLDWNNPHPSALHHLHELCAAFPALKRGSALFVDDNSGEVGKGMYVRRFLSSIGAPCIYSGYQVGYLLR
jgi:hypothetical protein